MAARTTSASNRICLLIFTFMFDRGFGRPRNQFRAVLLIASRHFNRSLAYIDYRPGIDCLDWTNMRT
ncbi:MAG: hypothetical protein DME65_10770 [Verrucomicrobia bacterium]|nr:MAG: hypothetical protein DME65_10770 [Verrucomicrobiota bacterium]